MRNYRSVVLLGPTQVGKSTLGGRLLSLSSLSMDSTHESTSPLDAARSEEVDYVKYRELCDSIASERLNGHSEQNCCRSVEIESSEAELIVIPGKRKFWKWHDYGCADADASMIVVRVREGGTLDIIELIEPISHSLAMGTKVAGVILNNFEGFSPETVMKCRLEVVADLERLFSSAATHETLIFEVSNTRPCTDLLRYMMRIPVPERDEVSPFEMSINSIFDKGDSVILGGKIRRGHLSVGQKVFLMPGRVELKISSIRISRERDVTRVSAGRVIAVLIQGGLSRRQVSVGMALVGDVGMGKETRLVRAEMSFFNNKHAIRAGFSPVVSILACQAHGKIVSVESKEEINLGDTAILTVGFSKTVFVQSHSLKSSFSRIVFRHSNAVIAVGVIREILDD